MEKPYYLPKYSYPLIDLHCDVLSKVRTGTSIINGRRMGHCDLPRMKKGGVSAIVFSLFVFPKFTKEKNYRKKIDKQLNILQNTIENSNGEMKIALSPDDVRSNFHNGVASIIIEIEGLHPLDDGLGLLQKYYDMGVRIFTLTWNNSNAFATSSKEAFKNGIDPGLTGLGRQAVAEINRLGALIDLSHASDQTFFDVFELSKTPPILSHSCLRCFKNSSRNITDEQLILLAERSGVIGINFYTNFLSSKSMRYVTIDTIVEQMQYIKERVGVDVTAFGSDFDGISHLPKGIDDISDFPKIIEALESNGFTQDEIVKISGGNFLRVFGEVSSKQ
ncbi:dipeptidase [bacterium]|nr:dipeptidase [bacterium]